jgi:hypothetical protein
MPSFAKQIPKPEKPSAGRTTVAQTPLTIRSRMPLDPKLRDAIRVKLGRLLHGLGPRLERASVRFEDINGPKRGVDTVCRIKVTMSGEPSVVVQSQAENPRTAFQLTAPRLASAVRRAAHRKGKKTPGPTRRQKAPPSGADKGMLRRDRLSFIVGGELIGRREGHGVENRDAALLRPEKVRRDVPVDTSEPGVSASARKAGGTATARRNTKANQAGMASMLEDTKAPGQPSRKSTRRATNRIKGATQLTGRTKRAVHSPEERAARYSRP